MAEAFAALFEKAQLGDRVARDAVYKLAFYRLKTIAAPSSVGERRAYLQPTALVSELFLKLHRLETRILNEDHFFRMSAAPGSSSTIRARRGRPESRSS
jgi:hypothetical protein